MNQMKNAHVSFIKTVIILLLKKNVKMKIVIKNLAKNLKNVEMGKMEKMVEMDLMGKTEKMV
jgi:hypothetical protein